MTLLAGFAALLQRLTGQEDLAVGTPIAGRSRAEMEPLIGLFVNTLVLRMDLAGDPGLGELLGRVRETALAAYAHQEVPFERLAEELAPDRDLSRPPLVQVLFALQNAPAAPLALPGLALAARAVETGTAKFELTCTLAEAEGALAGALEYRSDLFEATSIARWAGSLVRLLVAAGAAPQTCLAELPLLTAAERHQLRVEWNDTAVPAAPGVVEQLAEQARQVVDAGRRARAHVAHQGLQDLLPRHDVVVEHGLGLDQGGGGDDQALGLQGRDPVALPAQVHAPVVMHPHPRARPRRVAGRVAEDDAHATPVGTASGGRTTSGPIRSGIAAPASGGVRANSKAS